MIRLYEAGDAEGLFSMLEREGGEWAAYWRGDGRAKYQRAIDGSVVYLAFADGVMCGYLRCRDDDGFGVYIYDLLVDKGYRCRGYGRRLMERVCADYPDNAVYVMSDADEYYMGKLGYEREGSILKVKING
jgi:ribosomal protein S18 acetylase RimI-like enzyme